MASCAALLVLGGCGEKTPPPEPLPIVAVAAPLQKSVSDWDDYAGRFEAMDAVEVRPRVAGQLQSVRFRDSQMVRKGEVLFVIDPRPFTAALAQARAQVAHAQAALANAATELGRAQALVQNRFVSQATVDLRVATEKQAAADLAGARAAADEAALNLSFTRVTAPVSGRVSYHRLAAGNLVSAGSTLLTTIMSVNPIRFVFDAPESAFLKYQRAQGRGGDNPVQIRLQDEHDYRWTGRLDSLDNAVDQGSGTIRGQATIANPTGFLTPGMFGQMRLFAPQPVAALMVPDEAVTTDQTRHVVYAVGPDGTVSQRPVTLGRVIEGMRVIRSGLSPRDRIVISGMQRAKPGRKVDARPGTISAFPSGVSREADDRASQPAGGPR